MNNKNNTVIVDERQKQIRGKAGAIAGGFAICCVLAAMIYRMAKTDSIGWEFWCLIGTAFVYAIACRVFGDIEHPKSILNKPLPLGDTKEEKRIRKKDYAFGSAIFATACAVMDIILFSAGKEDMAEYEFIRSYFPSLDKTQTIVLTAVFAFVSMFLISYLFDYLVGEYKVRKYNETMKELDEDQ